MRFFQFLKKHQPEKKQEQKTAPVAVPPQHFVNGWENEHRIHLGSYYRNAGDREDCSLDWKDGEWYLNSAAFWPVWAGASNGGSSHTKLDAQYLTYNDIWTAEDFMKQIYRGNLSPCLSLLREHEDVLRFLEDLVKSKTAPNYCQDGLFLLWEMDAQQTGVIIHKIFSCEKETLTIPAQIDGYPVREFGYRAAVNLECSRLILPDTIKAVNGISGCRNLRQITLPASVKSCCPFLECNSLENIYVAEGNQSFCSVDGVMYTKDITKLLRCPEHKSGVLEISDRTTSIESWACADCGELTGVALPDALTKIGGGAFKNCKKVAAFVLPEGITEISWGAFANIDRERILCKKDSYAYRELEKNFSNPCRHGNYPKKEV